MCHQQGQDEFKAPLEISSTKMATAGMVSRSIGPPGGLLEGAVENPLRIRWLLKQPGMDRFHESSNACRFTGGGSRASLCQKGLLKSAAGRNTRPHSSSTTPTCQSKWTEFREQCVDREAISIGVVADFLIRLCKVKSLSTSSRPTCAFEVWTSRVAPN